MKAMRPAAKDGIFAMELAAPVIADGLGASASCAIALTIINTRNTAVHSNLNAAPAIISKAINHRCTDYSRELFDILPCFEMQRV